MEYSYTFFFERGETGMISEQLQRFLDETGFKVADNQEDFVCISTLHGLYIWREGKKSGLDGGIDRIVVLGELQLLDNLLDKDGFKRDIRLVKDKRGVKVATQVRLGLKHEYEHLLLGIAPLGYTLDMSQFYDKEEYGQ